MSRRQTRRQLLSVAVSGSLAGLGGLSLFDRLAPVSASEAEVKPRSVVFRPEIEPLVQLLEDTPRETVLNAVGERLRAGVAYRDLLAALFLAGIRNIQPRPAVGFKFHAVLVIHAAHLASISAPDSDRWLPIFWAIDEFKSSQARDVAEGNWTMSAVNDSMIPVANEVHGAFEQAMDDWDEERADSAAAGLARSAASHEAFELFARYCIRDFRSIGHKAIYVANGWRTMECIGWQHAEPILRSLAYALLNHQGEANPAKSDLAADRPWRRNLELVQRVAPNWRAGRIDAAATKDLLSTLRSGSENDAADQVVEMLNRGVAAQSIVDALFVGAGELLMRQPGIASLHAVTSTNAMHYLFQTSANDQTRLLALLQNAAFLPLFHKEMQRRGNVGTQKIDELAGDVGNVPADRRTMDIIETIGNNGSQAASKLLGYLQQGGSINEFITAARRVIFLKGRDSHDYKFSSAILEDFFHISPNWRDQFLASSVYQLRGSSAPDNDLVPRIRAAIANT